MLDGRSDLMGVCADIGHWVRSGLNPVDCLRQLEGRVISLHIKDLNKFGVRDAHDLPWGTGNSNVAGCYMNCIDKDLKARFLQNTSITGRITFQM